MIIKKNTSQSSKNTSSSASPAKSGKILKGGVKSVQKSASNVDEFSPEIVSDIKEELLPPPPKKTELEIKLEEYEKIDVTTPEFKERYERRRGERRRGFRRIDERGLVSRAQGEAQSIRELAAKEGYEAGIKEAQAEIQMLKTSLVEFVGAKNAVYDEASEHILEIALEVAKKIIKKEVELSNDVLKSVLSEVLSELSTSEEKITIKVNPEDVDFTKASLPEILSDSPIDAKIVVIGEELIQKGSCTVIASNGVVDANFSTQLSIVQNAFGIYDGGN